jgi:ABC-2 type transport system ATP-binding protein
MDETVVSKAKKLRCRFNDFEAVAGISFQVEGGEIFELLGLNGAGKTTTLHLLTGQIDPGGVRARVVGCDMVKDPSI